MADKKGVIILYKYQDLLAKLPLEEQGRILQASLKFDMIGELTEFENPVTDMLFSVMVKDFTAMKENWEDTVDARSEAGKKGAEARWSKTQSSTNKPMATDGKNANAIAGNSKNGKGISEMATDSKNANNDNDNDKENENSLSAEAEKSDSPSPAKKKPSGKVPLLDREPVNDYERVEKRYLENWKTLFQQGKVKTENPVVNWGQTRSLLKTLFGKVKPEQVIGAVDRAATDDWIVSNGYCFGTILSATVFNRLINSTAPPAGGSSQPKTALGGFVV